MIKKTLILLSLVIFSVPVLTQTDGKLEVSVNTTDTGGKYKPKNVLAIWIEDDAGNFIKTLLAMANKRKTHLNTWQETTAAAGSEYNTVDAITGATLNNHGARACSWDGTDFNGNVQEDGNYLLWMELTDKNSTGNFSSFVIEKGAAEYMLNPGSEESFSNIKINWTPDDPSSLDFAPTEKLKLLNFNPVHDLLVLQEEPSCSYFIIGMNGELFYYTDERQIAVEFLPAGLYFLLFEDGRSERFVKQE